MFEKTNIIIVIKKTVRETDVVNFFHSSNGLSRCGRSRLITHLPSWKQVRKQKFFKSMRNPLQVNTKRFKCGIQWRERFFLFSFSRMLSKQSFRTSKPLNPEQIPILLWIFVVCSLIDYDLQESLFEGEENLFWKLLSRQAAMSPNLSGVGEACLLISLPEKQNITTSVEVVSRKRFCVKIRSSLFSIQ
jgi:hypothetical protein